MPKYYKEFTVTGVANVETLDGGITSTEAEKKRVVAVIVNVSGYADNIVVAKEEREKIMGIYDKVFNTDADLGAANFPYSTAKLNRIEIDRVLDLGRTFKIGISCGATAKNLHGAYEYEIVS